MITAEIHSGWQMRQAGWEEFLPASVPGSVYHDLMQNGKFPQGAEADGSRL